MADQPHSITGNRPVDRLRLISLFTKTEPTKKPRGSKKAGKKAQTQEPKRKRKPVKRQSTKGKKRTGIKKRQRKSKK